jgi:flavodoxin
MALIVYYSLGGNSKKMAESIVRAVCMKELQMQRF